VIATDNLRHLHDRLRSGIWVVAELEEDLLEREPASVKLEGFDHVVDYLTAVVLPHLHGELAVLYPEARLLSGIDENLVRELVGNCQALQRDAQRVVHDRQRLRHGACDNVGYRRHITNLVRRLRRHLEAVETLLLPELGKRLSDESVYAIYRQMEEAQFEAIVEPSRSVGVPA
jgi:hypothetical protein